MISKKELFIHVGYPKSASTTIQKNVFNQHSEILNLGIYPSKNIGSDIEYGSTDNIYLNDDNLKSFYYQICMLDEFDIDFDKIKSDWEIIENKYIRNNHKIVLSNERFNSVFFAYDDIAVKAKRIKYLFPNAKILIVLRNQMGLLKSQYSDHPFDPRHFIIGKPVSFDEWIRIAYENDRDVKLLKSLNYAKVIKLYKDLFGMQNVCPLLFEDLVQNKIKFANNISDFMDIDKKEMFKLINGPQQNVGVSNRYNLFRRYIQRGGIGKLGIGKYVPNLLKNEIVKIFKSGKKQNIKPNITTCALLENYFDLSNKSLQLELGVDLKKYKYPIK